MFVTGPRGPTVRGPVVRGPIVRGPICLEPKHHGGHHEQQHVGHHDQKHGGYHEQQHGGHHNQEEGFDHFVVRWKLLSAVLMRKRLQISQWDRPKYTGDIKAKYWE